MQRRSPIRRLGVIAVSIALVTTACQSEGDDAIEGTPIEEPSSVTESTNEPTSESTTPPETTDDDTTTDSADETNPPPDPTTTLVLATQPPAKTTPVITAPPGEPSTETIYEVGKIDPGLAPFVAIATDDLADRLGVEPTAIEVLTAVLVTWPDSAIGCREPDRMYTPALVDGSVIELGVDGLVYRYHSGGDRTPFPCDRPLDPAPLAIG